MHSNCFFLVLSRIFLYGHFSGWRWWCYCHWMVPLLWRWRETVSWHNILDGNHTQIFIHIVCDVEKRFQRGVCNSECISLSLSRSLFVCWTVDSFIVVFFSVGCFYFSIYLCVSPLFFSFSFTHSLACYIYMNHVYACIPSPLLIIYIVRVCVCDSPACTVVIIFQIKGNARHFYIPWRVCHLLT